MSFLRPLGLGLLAAVTVPAAAFAAASPPGDVILDVRLRSESVDQDGFNKNAHALTVRTRFGYETAAWRGFKALIEGENVTALDESYNSGTNGKTTYPTVSDPETTELNRLQVSWAAPKGDVTVGRQRIILGNARFVGNAGFRQNEQTFDAVKAAFRPSKSVTVTYVYVDKVRRVFGHKHPQGEWDSNSHFVQADAKTPVGQLTGYGYLMEFKNAAAQSNSTWGARFVGSRPLSKTLSATYEAEYAHQNDYQNNPADFSLDYVAGAVGLKGAKLSGSLGIERLEGDGRRGFQTPLATLHAFQGWADVFLTTPTTGVRDLNLRAAANLKIGPKGHPARLQLAAHDFNATHGSANYGRELDLLASTPINKHVSTELKAAIFDGDLPAYADRTKIWLTLEVKY